jgi:hypothetical protein
MKKIHLTNVTLLAMTSVKIEETILSLMFSSQKIEFSQITLVTHEIPHNLPEKIKFKKTDYIGSIDEWNRKVVFEMHKYVDTDFVLLIHDDGFVVNPESWRDEFTNYDYIGAPWLHHNFYDSDGNLIRVGNSVSLRSKKLLTLPSEYNMPWQRHDGNYNEDTQICVWNRDFFLNKGIKFAEFDVAKYFSHETYFPEYENIMPFCFHNFGDRNSQYKKLIEEYKLSL